METFIRIQKFLIIMVSIVMSYNHETINHINMKLAMREKRSNQNFPS